MQAAGVPQAETHQREAQIAQRLQAVLPERLQAVLPEPAARQGPMQQVDGPLLAVQAVLEAAPKVAAVREGPRRLAVDPQLGALRRVAQILEALQTVVLPQLNRN